jgi:hypothetical protein
MRTEDSSPAMNAAPQDQRGQAAPAPTVPRTDALASGGNMRQMSDPYRGTRPAPAPTPKGR